ncbi:MAG: DUF4139 domain-containing protein [Rhodospirillales bacterium]
MIRTILRSLSIAIAVAWWVGAGSVAVAAELALKRVMLSTGGVGYFEYEARVEGDADLELEVRLDQVDDVLKSIVVYDDTGAVGTISLPGRKPLAQVFRDLPFGRKALTSPVRLLNALQGARVAAVGQRRLQGRIIRVEAEKTQLGDGRATVTRHRVSLLTADGVQQFVLEEAESVRFVDGALQAQVERALAATARHRVRGKRTLSIAVKGKKQRTVRVAYVAAAPLWKSTYRLTLSGGGGADSALMQGWAVIENMSGHDWTGVELTMVSGNPVTFRQALYASYYVERPEVPVEVLGRILPRPDQGAVGRADKVAQARPGKKAAKRRARRGGITGAPSKALSAFEMGGRASDSTAAPPASAPRPAPPALLAESREAATQVLFRLPEPVSVESGDSLVVPIVNREVPARRVALYQPATHATRPLASLRLKNDGPSGLPPGVLTIYERAPKSGAVAYVGDARLTTLPAGEERLVSFALDQKTKVDRAMKHRQTLARGSVNRGVFKRTVIDRQTTTYRLKAPAREERTVLVEHPRRTGWKLVSPRGDGVELTKNTYRMEVKLDKGAKEVFEVVMERPRQETLRVMSMSSSQIASFARANALSAEVRKAFARMAELKSAMARHGRDEKTLEDEQKTIVNDQKRIRGNIARIARGSDLYNRYIQKLNKQEDRLESLVEAIGGARARRKKAEDAFADYVSKLKT